MEDTLSNKKDPNFTMPTSDEVMAKEGRKQRAAINRAKRARLGFANRHEDRAHDKRVRKEQQAAKRVQGGGHE